MKHRLSKASSEMASDLMIISAALPPTSAWGISVRWSSRFAARAGLDRGPGTVGTRRWVLGCCEQTQTGYRGIVRTDSGHLAVTQSI